MSSKSKSKSRLGQTSVKNNEIEQLLKGLLLQHLSSAKRGEQYKGGVLGELVISPSEGTMEWVPGTTTTSGPDGSAS